MKDREWGDHKAMGETREAQETWIFGYGSLMWRPGFDFVEKKQALLYGYHRSLCVYSFHHRGTEERPGLVLGLDRGGACRGVAYKVDQKMRDGVVSYLREREQVTMVYKETSCSARLLGGRKQPISALTYVADRGHAQYAGKLSHAEQVRHIIQGAGKSGANPEYLANTVSHLEELGIKDLGLTRLWRDVEHHRHQR